MLCSLAVGLDVIKSTSSSQMSSGSRNDKPAHNSNVLLGRLFAPQKCHINIGLNGREVCRSAESAPIISKYESFAQ